MNVNIKEILNKAHELKRANKIEEAIILLEEINSKTENVSVIRVLASFLMDSLNYKKITEFGRIKEFDPRSYAIAKSFLDGNINNTDTICLNEHPVMEKTAFVSMIKDEEDIIFFNLLWHYELGLRKFFIINNMSTDKTLNYVHLFEQLFNDAEVFILHDPIVAHYQGKKTTGACRFAISIWDNLEWLLLTDADEFLCPTMPLHQIFENTPPNIDVIVVPKSFYNLVPGESIENTDLFFNRINHRTPITHISSKAIMRANLNFTVNQGNHHIFDHNGAPVKNYACNLNLTYREYRMRSHLHYKKKVLNGGKAVEAAKQQGFAQVGGGHWEALYNLYLKQGDAGLQRHFENFIKNQAANTTIFDPLPLGKIIEKINYSKKIDILDLIK